MMIPGKSDAVAETPAPHERASATPEVRARRSAVGELANADSRQRETSSSQSPALPNAEGARATGGSLALHDQQRWFAGAVMTPESHPLPSGATAVERVLTAGPRLSALDRLEIYRRAYHARLIECLADDYPALQSALGAEAFDGLCRAYIERHPSTGPNLNAFGQSMPSFCRTAEAACRESAFAADLATLEWAIVEVIHARSAPAVTIEALHAIPVDRWADARLIPTPAFRLLRFAYPVNAYFQSFRQGTTPLVPALAGSSLLVYRSGPTVWRMPLTEPMVLLLEATAQGETLGTSLERAAASLTDVPEEVAGARVMGWFRDWVSSGLFCDVEAPPEPSSSPRRGPGQKPRR
jgi:hypothetical protein